MDKVQKGVLEFHKAFDIFTRNFPGVPPPEVIRFRKNLIDEEYEELKQAFLKRDMVEIADALGDLLYVIYGAALACGIDMEPVSEEIQRSNMSKVGGTKRGDGKLIKPDTYSPPSLIPILKVQSVTGLEDL